MTKKTKENFKILGDIEHILLRSAMYIGSTEMESKTLLLDYKFQTVNLVAGLFKIVNELIDNSIDEYIRTEGKFANKIEVTMDNKTFTVKDNGRGIPVEQIVDTNGKKIYKPVAAWTRPRAGSNFSDDNNRVTAGMNGVGSALSNIFSKEFIGETSDGKNHLIVKCKDNANIESIKVKASTKKFTQVTISPDFSRFGVSEFDETIQLLVRDRLSNISLAFPKIQFKFNGQSCNIQHKSFVSKFADTVSYSDANVNLILMPSDGEFRQHSVINGLIIYNGGSHVEYVMNGICGPLREKIKKKYKIDLLPSKIKSQLTLILTINGFKNAKFESQSKERITNTSGEIANHLSHIDFESLAKDLMKNDNVILPMVKTQLDKITAEDDKAADKLAKDLKSKKIANHVAATSRIPDKRTLFVMEGLSAFSPFIAARNPETQGGIPLKGKVLNTFGASKKEILENKELSELISVIGLTLGKKASQLNYGTIAIATDQDVDGNSIRGLLINFFYNWPELFEQGRIKILNSPRYILRGKKDRKYFYTKEEFDNYKGSKSGYELAYIKGLGSLEIEEYEDMLASPKFEVVSIDNPELLAMMYGDDAVQRKEFMMK